MNPERLRHRYQARRIGRACREIRLLNRLPNGDYRYDTISGMLLAIFTTAVDRCRLSGNDWPMLHNWLRVAERAKACLENHLRHAEVNPNLTEWDELLAVAQYAQLVDNLACVVDKRLEKVDDTLIDHIFNHLDGLMQQVKKLPGVAAKWSQGCELPELKVERSGEPMSDEQLLAALQLLEPGSEQVKNEKTAGGAQSQAIGPGRTIFATRYIIRFADDKINDPPETRRLRVFYRASERSDQVEETGPVVEASIEGRFFEAESGERYFLWKPDAIYRDWLAPNGVMLEEDHPFAFDRRDGEKWVFGPLRTNRGD